MSTWLEVVCWVLAALFIFICGMLLGWGISAGREPIEVDDYCARVDQELDELERRRRHGG